MIIFKGFFQILLWVISSQSNFFSHIFKFIGQLFGDTEMLDMDHISEVDVHADSELQNQCPPDWIEKSRKSFLANLNKYEYYK